MPVGPSITVMMRSSFVLASSGAGIVSFCTSIGGNIVGLSDFANAAALFGRFTITRAKLVVLPGYFAGQVVAGVMLPLSIGYFNDQTAVALPTTAN
jgi:hypothetical protein